MSGQLKNLFRHFKEADYSLEIKHRSGKPSVVNLEELKEKNRREIINTQKLLEDLGPRGAPYVIGFNYLCKLKKVIES